MGLLLFMVLLTVCCLPVVASSPSENPKPGESRPLHIDQPGLLATGEVVLTSASPAEGELRLRQLQGTPQEVFGFLAKRMTLPEVFASSRKEPNLHLEDLVLRFSPSHSQFSASSIAWSGGQMQQVRIEIGPMSSWKLLSAQGRLDRLPPLLNSMKQLLGPDWKFSSLQLSGDDQHITLVATDLKSELGSLERLEITLSPPRSAAEIAAEAIAPGEPSLDQPWLHLKAKDSKGGVLTLKRAALLPPPDLTGAVLHISADKFSWAGFLIHGEFGWRTNGTTPLALQLQQANGLKLTLKGRTQPWRLPDRLGMDIIIQQLKVSGIQETRQPSQSTSNASVGDPLFPNGAPLLPFPIRVQADWVEIDRLPDANRVVLQTLHLGNPQGPSPKSLQLAARGNWCDTDLTGELWLAADGELNLQLQSHIRDLSFSNLIACWLAAVDRPTPPIYLEGKSNGRFFLESRGYSQDDLKRHLQGDFSLNVRDGRIMQLSRIDWSWGFILDILQAVNLNPTEFRDTLPFDNFALRSQLADREMDIHRVQLRSPLLQVSGNGRVDYRGEAPMLELDLHVATEVISKQLKPTAALRSHNNETANSP